MKEEEEAPSNLPRQGEAIKGGKELGDTKRDALRNGNASLL